jgi:hypothetical protein
MERHFFIIISLDLISWPNLEQIYEIIIFFLIIFMKAYDCRVVYVRVCVCAYL